MSPLSAITSPVNPKATSGNISRSSSLAAAMESALVTPSKEMSHNAPAKLGA
jgi:hypothetical protein